MKPKSCKAKGRLLQQLVRDSIIEVFDHPAELVKCAIMGESGADVVPLGTTLGDPLHIAIECKAVEAFSLYASWKQTVDNASKLGRRPVLVTRRNNSTAMAVVTLEHLLTLMYIAQTGNKWKIGVK